MAHRRRQSEPGRMALAAGVMFAGSNFTISEAATARVGPLVEKDGFEPEIRLAVLASTQSETAVQPKRHSPSLSPPPAG